ncbi:EF-hand calcium-binding domain-containing protein 6-like [Clavelina lepadiformis]|uniref:EF-hand calcium-binding domain-containing protein 6-like n=1 Tax=Clavelina lepadiformis TaxID=159417 RepID=UPI0040434230
MASAQVLSRGEPSREPALLRPSSRGIVFSPRPALNTGRNVRSLRSSSMPPSRSFQPPSHVSSSGSKSAAMLLAKPKLTALEVESVIKQKVNEQADAIRQAFHVYDAERCTNVTKGEFRRVLENYCLPLTTDQFNHFLAKVHVNPNGTISYKKFLEKFSGNPLSPPVVTISKSAVVLSGNERDHAGRLIESKIKPQKFAVSKTSQEQSIDTIERHLQHKIADNLKNVVRGLRLFDYNRDGQVQRHELRRVIETYCLKLSDSQFDKLWSRYDFHHIGAIDYREFLRRLGVNAATGERQLLNVSQDSGGNDAPWDAKKKRLEREKDVTDLVLNRNKDRNKRRSRRTQEMSFTAIEKEFRKKMQVNYENIQRAMMSFDFSGDGFITIEDLKAVIDNFVLPTTDEIFHQLMYKYEVRGTGKVSWEQFLGKFQDPQSSGNGQTLPIGQNHKVNPIRHSLGDATTPEILKKLKKHVLNNYSTLKQAFLAFDENRKGVITRRDLRRIVETFALKLTDDNFKDLMIELDPQHTGLIHYHNFLKLFEPKESVSAHKWLFSDHKFNENQPPAIMAWETVEEILREKLSENYKLVASEFAALDKVEDGSVSKTHLRRLIDRYALPVSDNHFNKMWNVCEQKGKDRIMLAQFLNNLGIDVQPGDLEGTSTRIHDESNERETRRVSDQMDRIGEIEKVDLHHTRIFSAPEVIIKLKQRMAQHDTAIRKTFLRYSKSGKGRVTKKDLKLMLEDMGFIMEETQFLELIKILPFNGKGLDYSDFIASFQDLRTHGMGQELERAGNHTVNPTNVKYMNAQECYHQIIERMRQNFGSVRSAFYKVDDDHDGVLTMEEFRRLLDSFMFIITDQTFQQLLTMLGLTRKSSLSYHDFLRKFEVVDKEEGHPWLNSEHRFNKTRSSAELAADKVHECLCMKAEQAWSDLAKAFQNFDADGNGIIKKKELRSILYRFILPMSNAQFQKLWNRYDEEGKGYITHQDFLRKLGVNFAAGDNLGLQGTSRKMVDENYQNVLNHHDFQQAKHEEIAFNQIKYSQHLTAETVERELKDRFREYYSDFDKAFRQMDKNKDGYITLADLQRVLLQLNYFLDEDQFVALLKRLGLPTTKSRLSYFDFLRAIDDGRASKFARPMAVKKDQVTWQYYHHLPLDRALAKLKDKVTVNYDSINAAFRAFDRAQTGLIKIADFRRLLDNFCFRLTDKQFKGVLGKCRISGGSLTNSSKMINWIVFLQDFSQIKDVRLKEWTDYVGKIAPPQTPQELSLDDVEDRMREVVSGRYYALSRAFDDIDYAKIYVVSKDDFRDILNEHVMRLTDDQFDRVWARQSVNEFNNIEYREFLKKYGDQDQNETKELSKHDAKATEEKDLTNGSIPRLPTEVNENALPPRPPSRLGTSDSMLSVRLASAVGSIRSSTPLVNAESAESKIKTLVYKHWQDIQRECRKLDSDGTGTVLPDEFVGLLDHFGVMLSIEEARQLMLKYNMGEKEGKFSYREFLRHFILTLKPHDEGLLKRRKIHTARLPIDTGKENASFVEAMVRLRERILLCWKEMRRTFRIMDTRAEGFVSPASFRQVLRQFSINMSEDDFFHLLSFYDPKMSGRLPYNDFIRAFLQ